MDAYQYFSEDGVLVGRAPVGSFHFDHRDGHQHWHFLQFARYRLLDASQVAIRSRKQAFCLAPTDPIDLTVDGAVWRPEFTGFSQCGSETSTWIREVLADGMGRHLLPGRPRAVLRHQRRSRTGRTGSRCGPIPAAVLFDGDPSNNVELREVILGGSPGARTVSVPPWHGIDTEFFYGFGG